MLHFCRVNVRNAIAISVGVVRVGAQLGLDSVKDSVIVRVRDPRNDRRDPRHDWRQQAGDFIDMGAAGERNAEVSSR